MRDETKPRRFGRWAGNPAGDSEDPARCVEEVFLLHGTPYQCQRKRGYGKHGAYCQQHATRFLVDVGEST